MRHPTYTNQIDAKSRLVSYKIGRPPKKLIGAHGIGGARLASGRAKYRNAANGSLSVSGWWAMSGK